MADRIAVPKTKLLEQAICDGKKTKVMKLLQQNIEVTATNEQGDTVLHSTLKSDKFSPNEIIEILDIFITRGADPCIKNNEQETVLHLAIADQLRDVVDFLLTKNSKIDVTDDEGNSLAHYFVKCALKKFLVKLNVESDPFILVEIRNVVEKESASFAEWLILKGFDFDVKNKNGQSALHSAIDGNLQHILIPLLKYTQDINFASESENRTLLHLFLKASHFAKSNGYKFQSLDPTQMKFLDTAIKVHSHAFSQRYDIEIIKILIGRGVSVDHVDIDGLTALNVAVNFVEHIDIVEILLENFTRINDNCGVALVCTVITNAINDSVQSDYYFKILSTLICKGTDVNSRDKDGLSLIYHAFMQKNLRAIELMKKNKVDFNVITNTGENLWHALAIKNNSYEPDVHDQLSIVLFDILTSEGCDIDAQNNKGQTPLHVALYKENFFVAQKLVECGANLNCQEFESKWSPLHIAVHQGPLEIVHLLLVNGAKINSQSRDGRPLHLALVKAYSTNIFELLFVFNAEVNARDPQGNTVLAKALVTTWLNVVEQLLMHGADINDFCVTCLLQRCQDKSSCKTLLEHCIKLKTANLPYSNEYEAFIVQDDDYEKLCQVCLTEIDELKRTFIDTNTTLYKWLHMDLAQRLIHCGNERLRSIVNSSELVKQFPKYSTVILGNYHETQAKQALLEPGKKVWLILTEIDLPDICIERILSYLNSGDLLDLAEMLNELDQN